MEGLVKRSEVVAHIMGMPLQLNSCTGALLTPSKFWKNAAGWDPFMLYLGPFGRQEMRWVSMGMN